MKTKYIAKLYLGQEEISCREGDDVDELFSWMLTETQDKFGQHSGEIIENKTGNVVRSYRKAPVE